MTKKIPPIDPELEAEWAELERLTKKRLAGWLERAHELEAR